MKKIDLKKHLFCFVKFTLLIFLAVVSFSFSADQKTSGGDFKDCTKGEVNDFYTTPLRTFEFNGIIIGGLICNDLWANPACTTLPDTHLTQQLSNMGARIIFHAVNGGRSDSELSNIFWDYHSTNLRVRAMAGAVWIVTADNSYPLNLRSSSPSGVINPEGKWVCETEAKGVQYFSYTIEIEY